jgi:hypothetical protein
LEKPLVELNQRMSKAAIINACLRVGFFALINANKSKTQHNPKG